MMMNRCVRGSSVIKGMLEIMRMILTAASKGFDGSPRCLFLLFLDECTTDETSSSGCDKTDLLSCWGESRHCGWVSNVLMVTSSVRMFDWVHCHTTDVGPVASLDFEHVVFDTGLHDWFIGTATTADDTDHSSAVSVDGLSCTGWQDDSSTETIFRVSDDCSAGSTCTGVLTLISSNLLDVHDDGTFWDLVDGEDVTDGNLGLGAAVDVLASVHTLWGNVEFRFQSIFIWVTEDNSGNWGTTAGVVNYFFDETSDVSVAFCVI